MLPLSLFRNSVFTTTSLVGLIVGFALFGSVTYLPLFLQVVNGASPTASGLQLLPVMGGLLIASIGSGQLITRTGRYKLFPIVGTAVMVIGLYLLSLMNAGTSVATASLYMFVLGLGLGLVMQVLVLAVQNAVPYSELGVATSGATLFRSIGGSFGASVLGAIFASQLTQNLDARVPGTGEPRRRPHRPRRPRAAAPGRPRRLRPGVHRLAQRRLPRRGSDRRRGVRAHLVHQGAAAPRHRRDRRAWARRSPFRRTPIRSPSSPASSASSLAASRQTASSNASRHGPRWTSNRPRSGCSVASTATPASTCARSPTPMRSTRSRLENARSALVAAGLIDGGGPLTERGKQTLDTLINCGRDRLDELSSGWEPEQHPELRELIQGLARQFIDTPVGLGTPYPSTP